MKAFFAKYILSECHTVVALIFGIILELLIFARLDDFISKALTSIHVRFIIYGLFILVWAMWWLYYQFYIPRNQKNKIGLVVAIWAESDMDEIRIKNDFISSLKRRIGKEKFKGSINIIKIQNHQVRRQQIFSHEAILKLHKRVRGHFYLYGSVKRRQDGCSTYFLSLDGMVVHRPIPLKASQALCKDFRTILPYQISFLESLEFKGFQFTADIVYLAVRYITGLAAFISGDVFFAHELHENLKQEFNKFRPLPENLRIIRDRANLLLADEETIVAKCLYQTGDYENSKRWLEKAKNTNPANYGVWLLEAIYDFQFNQDPIKALRSIKKAERYSRDTFEWRYSKAFLYFWLEKYEKAVIVCSEIGQQSYKSENCTLGEVENFVLATIEKERQKVQLYFWIGYLAYKKTGNFPKALEYFEAFEKKATNSMDYLLRRSGLYLKEIKNELNIKG